MNTLFWVSNEALPGIQQAHYRGYSILKGMISYGADYDYEVLFDDGPDRFMSLKAAMNAIDYELAGLHQQDGKEKEK